MIAKSLYTPVCLDGPQVKGQLHAHTTLSDGDFSPAELVTRYEEAGYDFLFLTDHNLWRDHSSLSTDKICVIGGNELGASSREHVLALGFDSGEIDGKQDTQSLIDAVGENGGVSCLNHPHWSAMPISRIHELQNYQLIEIHNTLAFRNGASEGNSLIWDDLLRAGRKVWGVATDDIHHEYDLFGGWVQLWCDSNEPDCVVDALRTGRFYSTEGPRFESIEVSENAILVKTSPVESICFVYERGNHAHRVQEDEDGNRKLLKGARFDRSPELYVRCQIRDTSGKRAWSNPIFVS